MITPDSAESMFIQPTQSPGDMMHDPGYPNPPEGRMPDLNLAGASGWPNSTGASIQVMPTPNPPEIFIPQLDGDPCMAGYEPSNAALAAPNLAGVDGTPQVTLGDTRENSGMSANDIIQPDYIEPNWPSLRPNVKPFNLVAPGIHLDVPGEFEADPMNPDLMNYNRPLGLNVHNITGTGTTLFRPDPLVGDLINYDVPNGVNVTRNPLTPDPNLPDLQPAQMQLLPAVTMSQRPGELDTSALQKMHEDPTYGYQAATPYNRAFIDQDGINTTRRRHFDLMMHGLDGEEES